MLLEELIQGSAVNVVRRSELRLLGGSLRLLHAGGS